MSASPYMGLNFMLYELLKDQVTIAEQRYQLSESAILTLQGCAGGISGGLSKLLVYPFVS